MKERKKKDKERKKVSKKKERTYNNKRSEQADRRKEYTNRPTKFSRSHILRQLLQKGYIGLENIPSCQNEYYWYFFIRYAKLIQNQCCKFKGDRFIFVSNVSKKNKYIAGIYTV